MTNYILHNTIGELLVHVLMSFDIVIISQSNVDVITNPCLDRIAGLANLC